MEGDYIVNPYTNHKVKLMTNKGITILAMYLAHSNLYQNKNKKNNKKRER